MARATFHSWCCPSCECFHETYGSRTDAEEVNRRECVSCGEDACTSCAKQCTVCEGSICQRDACLITANGDVFCHPCAKDVLGVLREEAEYLHVPVEVASVQAEIDNMTAALGRIGVAA